MRTSKSLTLSQAIDGMLFYKRAAGKSPNTLDSYRFLPDKLKLYFKDDPSFVSITRDQLIQFFAWLRDDYKPEPSNGRGRHVDKLTTNARPTADRDRAIIEDYLFPVDYSRDPRMKCDKHSRTPRIQELAHS